MLTLRVRLGRVIRDRRQFAKLSQEALGLRAGLHRTYVGQLERGEVNVGLDALERLADALGTSLGALFAAVDAMLNVASEPAPTSAVLRPAALTEDAEHADRNTVDLGGRADASG